MASLLPRFGRMQPALARLPARGAGRGGRTVVKAVRFLSWLAALGAVVLTAGAALSPHTPGAALLNNVLLQVATGTLGLVVLLALLRRWRPALLTVAMLGCQAVLLAPGADLGGIASSARASAAGPVRVVAYNLLYANHDHARSLDFLRHEAADVVLLEEVTPEWAGALEGLDDVYPYRIQCAYRRACFLALLSRIPLDRASAGFTADGITPVVEAVVTLDDRQVRVVGTHITHGLYRGGFAYQARQLDSLARHLNAGDMPTVLGGDFNMAPWAPRLLALARDTGLAVTPGLAGTWPASLPVPARVPIDHVLVSADLRADTRTVGPDLGSDHRPVTVTLSFTPTDPRPSRCTDQTSALGC